MDHDELVAEATVVLWRSWVWCEAKGWPRPVDPIWWSAWTRRESDLVRKWVRRQSKDCAHDAENVVSLFGDPTDDPMMAMVDLLVGVDPEAAAFARMLSLGYPVEHIKDTMRLSHRGYYAVRRRLQDYMAERLG